MMRLTSEQIPEQLSEISRRRRYERLQCRGERFIKGPIPWPWVRQAAALPGKTLAVAMAIWHIAGMAKSRKDIRVTEKLGAQLGVDRKARYRALERLEAAGLIVVHRRPGACPRVDILHEPGISDGEIDVSQPPSREAKRE